MQLPKVNTIISVDITQEESVDWSSNDDKEEDDDEDSDMHISLANDDHDKGPDMHYDPRVGKLQAGDSRNHTVILFRLF